MIPPQTLMVAHIVADNCPLNTDNSGVLSQLDVEKHTYGKCKTAGEAFYIEKDDKDGRQIKIRSPEREHRP